MRCHSALKGYPSDVTIAREGHVCASARVPVCLCACVPVCLCAFHETRQDWSIRMGVLCVSPITRVSNRMDSLKDRNSEHDHVEIIGNPAEELMCCRQSFLLLHQWSVDE